MRHLLFLLCLSTVSAQTGWNKYIFWNTKKGPVRSGLIAGYDLKVSGQTIPNLVIGGSSLQLGPTSGVDSSDPTQDSTGLVFDGVDDYAIASIPINMAAVEVVWVTATTNTTPGVIFYGGIGVACNGNLQAYYASTSAGNASRCGDSGAAALSGTLGSFHSLSFSNQSYTNNVYLNGNFLSTYTGNSPAPLNATSFMLGDQGAVSTFPFKGTISYLLIYNRKLSTKEIKQNHQWFKSQMSKVGVSLP